MPAAQILSAVWILFVMKQSTSVINVTLTRMRSSFITVWHVVARDGFSGKIVSYVTLPIKNNLAIYDEVFRYNNWQKHNKYCFFLSEKLWTSTDYGIKWGLIMDVNFTIYIQEYLQRQYGASHILPYVQSRSTEVHYIDWMYIFGTFKYHSVTISECSYRTYLARGESPG